jgi:hypothetical protein
MEVNGLTRKPVDPERPNRATSVIVRAGIEGREAVEYFGAFQHPRRHGGTF